MQIHGRAKLGPAGPLALTQAVLDGMTLRQAAGCFGVSVATAHRWWHRRSDASVDELASGAWLFDRSSRPRRSPRLLDAIEQPRICEARRHTGWGPRLIIGRSLVRVQAGPLHEPAGPERTQMDIPSRSILQMGQF